MADHPNERRLTPESVARIRNKADEMLSRQEPVIGPQNLHAWINGPAPWVTAGLIAPPRENPPESVDDPIVSQMFDSFRTEIQQKDERIAELEQKLASRDDR